MFTDGSRDFVGWDFLAGNSKSRVASDSVGVRINGGVYGSGVT